MSNWRVVTSIRGARASAVASPMIVKPIQTNTAPLKAVAQDGEVVVLASGPRPVDAAFTPEAILASLEGLRRAAERALAQKARRLRC